MNDGPEEASYPCKKTPSGAYSDTYFSGVVKLPENGSCRPPVPPNPPSATGTLKRMHKGVPLSRPQAPRTETRSGRGPQRLSELPQPDIITSQQMPPPPAYSRVTAPVPEWRVHDSNRAVLVNGDKSAVSNAHSLSSFAVQSNAFGHPPPRHVQYQSIYHNSSRSEPGGHLT